MALSKAPISRICIACGKAFVTHDGPQKYCSSKCAANIYNRKRNNLMPKPTIKITCEWCGKLFLPAHRKNSFCSAYCEQKRKTDIDYFDGHYRDAIGYKEGRCWICDKDNLTGGQRHVHHIFGRKNTAEPLVVLCMGCHELVSKLGVRNFLEDAHKVADLITLARFAKGLPDMRTIVIYEKTNK